MTAKEARDESSHYKVMLEVESILQYDRTDEHVFNSLMKEIKEATLKGKFEIRITSHLSDNVNNKLIELGYDTSYNYYLSKCFTQYIKW